MTRPDDPHAARPGENIRMVPPGPPRPLDAVESFRQGARSLFSNVLPWVLSMLIVIAVIVIVMIVVIVPVALSEDRAGEQAVALSPATVAALILVYVITFILGMLWTLNVYRNAVRQLQGGDVTLGDFFRFHHLGIPFVAYLLMSLAVLVGSLLLVLPGLVAAFFLMYVPYLAFTRPETGMSAIFRASVSMVRVNPGQSLLLVVFSLLLNAVGSLTVIGVLITTPLTACMMAHAALQGSGDRVVYRP